MAALTRARSAFQSIAVATTQAEWIIAIRALLAVDTYWEEAAVDAAATKRWTLAKPKTGSPNVNQRILFYADTVNVAPADLNDPASAGTVALWVGYAPTGGLVTFGNPVTDATLFTGGTATQRRYSGAMGMGVGEAAGGGFSGLRFITSPEDLIVYLRGDADEVYPAILGAWIEAEGLTAESDGRIHGWSVENGNVAGSRPLQDAWLDTATAGGKRWLRSHAGATHECISQVFDPSAPTTKRQIVALPASWNVTTQSVADDAGLTMLEPIHYRYASGATTGRIGHSRSIYIWKNDVSMRQVTTGSGAVIKGWTVGSKEATAQNTVLIASGV